MTPLSAPFANNEPKTSYGSTASFRGAFVIADRFAEIEIGNFRKSKFRKFPNGKIQNPQNAKSLRPIWLSSNLFGNDPLTTARPRLDLLKGRARRRCFPCVARRPLPSPMLPLGPPARLRVFPEASYGEPQGKAATRAMPTTRARRPQSVRSPAQRRKGTESGG